MKMILSQAWAGEFLLMCPNIYQEELLWHFPLMIRETQGTALRCIFIFSQYCFDIFRFIVTGSTGPKGRDGHGWVEERLRVAVAPAAVFFSGHIRDDEYDYDDKEAPAGRGRR